MLKPIRFLILVLMGLQLLHPGRDAVAVDWAGKRTQMVLMDLMPRGDLESFGAEGDEKGAAS